MGHMRPRLVTVYTDGSSDSGCTIRTALDIVVSLCSRTVDLLLSPSKKEKRGSPKKLTHFYSPLVHWANHVLSSGSLLMLTSKGTRWRRFANEAKTLEPLTSSTTIFDANAVAKKSSAQTKEKNYRCQN
ncbi:hypothetical protein TNCV_1945481 [Trichonephila clavipes]|nr:hypothetical protein TNCV_1945481 [Trichonephila clavipes]